MDHRPKYKARTKEQESRGENLHNLTVGKDVLAHKEKLTIRGKNWLTAFKIQNACSGKKKIRKIKREDQDQKKILSKCIWKGSVSKT